MSMYIKLSNHIVKRFHQRTTFNERALLNEVTLKKLVHDVYNKGEIIKENKGNTVKLYNGYKVVFKILEEKIIAVTLIR